MYVFLGLVFVSLYSIDSKAQTTKNGFIVSDVMCKHASSIRSVFTAGNDEERTIIAKAQVLSGECAPFTETMLVKVEEEPVDSIVMPDGNIVYIWKLKSKPEYEFYVYSVEEAIAVKTQ
jgi:hypothetical protein